jgi:putative autoinducer-2 (AI-2) aldolase
MPEADAREDKISAVTCPRRLRFLLKARTADWGLKNRLSKIFDPVSGRTVMLAIDHGYPGPHHGPRAH